MFRSFINTLLFAVQWHGYTIPKGAIVTPNLLSVSMDDKTFPEPKRFDPTRFLDENGKCTGHNKIMPFSIGMSNSVLEIFTRGLLYIFDVHMRQFISSSRSNLHTNHILQHSYMYSVM